MRFLPLLFLLGFATLQAAPAANQEPHVLVVELKKQTTPAQARTLAATFKTYAKAQAKPRRKVKPVRVKNGDQTRQYLVVRRFENKRQAKAFYKAFKKQCDKSVRKQLRKGKVMAKRGHRAALRA